MPLEVTETQDILEIAGIFPHALCVKLIECYRNSPEDIKFKFGPREGKLIELSGDEPGYKELTEECLVGIRPAISLYRNHYKFFDKMICGGFKIVEYREGEGCSPHYDGYESDGLMKIASVVVYLNDDFSAGETVFTKQKMSVKPAPGKVVFFPSGPTHPHYVEKTENGTRYALLTWMHADSLPSIKTVLRYAFRTPTYFD